MNKTPHVVGGGLGTFAKAHRRQRLLELARQAHKDCQDNSKNRKAQQLVNARTPQAVKAREFTLGGKNVESMDPARPARAVFDTALELFLSARAVKGGARPKGAITVAVDAAAEQHQPLFDNPQTQPDALSGVGWAKAALRWAGKELYDEKSAQPVKVEELVSA